jgi:hypothetical protein
MAAEQTVLELYPWLGEFGFTDIVADLIIQGITNPTAILAEIRKSPQHAQMFPSQRRSDGTIRMSEGDYLKRLDDYRQVMAQHGRDTQGFTQFEMAQFLEQEIDPTELNDRFTIYEGVKRGGRDIRDAFYVYAGIRLSDDDLYNYVVNGDERVTRDAEYQRRVTASPVDYETFITRATEAGLDRVVETLDDLQGSGVSASNALGVIRNLDPQFASQMTDILFGPFGEGLSNLSDLTNAFQVAMIGGAASAAGFSLPTIERVEEFRRAGVDRSRALEGYSLLGRQGDSLAGQVARLNQGQSFGQQDFEDAVFLQDADSVSLLEKASGREASFGRSEGSAAMSQGRRGIQQTGLTGRY